MLQLRMQSGIPRYDWLSCMLPAANGDSLSLPCRYLKSKNGAELIMGRITLVIAVLAGLITPAFAQKAEIEAVNAKWMEFFNKGDWAGVASLYTDGRVITARLSPT